MATPTLKPCKSSNLAAFGYDADSRTLAVQFHGNPTPHLYADVPPEVAAGMENAESIGRYFIANVRTKFKHQAAAA